MICKICVCFLDPTHVFLKHCCGHVLPILFSLQMFGGTGQVYSPMSLHFCWTTNISRSFNTYVSLYYMHKFRWLKNLAEFYVLHPLKSHIYHFQCHKSYVYPFFFLHKLSLFARVWQRRSSKLLQALQRRTLLKTHMFCFEHHHLQVPG